MTYEAELAIDRDVPTLDTAARRALIESELRKDAGRSDREIARTVGCDHKTVGSARERLGIPSPLGNSPQTVVRQGKAVDPDGREAAGGRELDESTHPSVQAAVDQCRGAMLRIREERQSEVDSEGKKNNERTLLIPRKEVTIQHDDEMSEWIIRQRNWPDTDGVIIIDDEDIHAFIDVLTDYLGYGRAP